jgi:transcriptional regulator with XRE-family HTH domain
MTLKEIARQANVSVSTVSRVINQKNTKAASPEVHVYGKLYAKAVILPMQQPEASN